MRLEELHADERRLVETLRAIPPSALRERFTTLVAELADFVAAPSCAEAQADGAPCASSQTACDECQKMTALIEGLRRRLHAD
jgi:hypothetical protein